MILSFLSMGGEGLPPPFLDTNMKMSRVDQGRQDGTWERECQIPTFLHSHGSILVNFGMEPVPYWHISGHTWSVTSLRGMNQLESWRPKGRLSRPSVDPKSRHQNYGKALEVWGLMLKIYDYHWFDEKKSMFSNFLMGHDGALGGQVIHILIWPGTKGALTMTLSWASRTEVVAAPFACAERCKNFRLLNPVSNFFRYPVWLVIEWYWMDIFDGYVWLYDYHLERG